MQQLASAENKQQLDAETRTNLGFPSMVLMEQAAEACWRIVKQRLPSAEGIDTKTVQIVIAAGSGNNGGDGLSIARRAVHEGYGVSVVHKGSKWKDLPARQMQMLEAYSVPCFDWESDPESCIEAFAGADCIVDALLGVGASRPLAGDLLSMVQAITRAKELNPRLLIAAIDLPSGLPAGAGHVSVCADVTAAIIPADIQLFAPAVRQRSGQIAFADAGFPPSAVSALETYTLLEESDIPQLQVPIAQSAYKGSRGHLCIYAGSSRYHGAAVLAASAAEQGPAGRVTVSVDPEIDAVIRSHLTATVIQSSEDMPPHGTRALLIGPGWDTNTQRVDLLARLLQLGLPAVIDGDGLTLLQQLAPQRSGDDPVNWVLTPHPGELARLAGVSVPEVMQNPVSPAHTAAQRYRAVVVAKSHVTYIVHPDAGVYVVDGMEPNLATAGSGDVLAGCIAGEAAADGDVLRAAKIGVLRHLVAGRSLGLASARQLPRLLGGRTS
ncbi:MAG: NAD(P)H-hydrate epimerase [Spirochaeta sp.]